MNGNKIVKIRPATPDPIVIINREVWLTTTEHSGYEVSWFGRVRSKDRVIIQKNGVKIKVKGKILKPVLLHTGYTAVSLGEDNQICIHVLVLNAFVGPCPPGKEARHFPDQTRSNNKLWNLSWASHKRNQLDRVANGTDHRGEKQYKAKLTNNKVRFIRKMIRTKQMTRKQLALKFMVCVSTIDQVIAHRNWKHVK